MSQIDPSSSLIELLSSQFAASYSNFSGADDVKDGAAGDVGGGNSFTRDGTRPGKAHWANSIIIQFLI